MHHQDKEVPREQASRPQAVRECRFLRVRRRVFLVTLSFLFLPSPVLCQVVWWKRSARPCAGKLLWEVAIWALLGENLTSSAAAGSVGHAYKAWTDAHTDCSNRGQVDEDVSWRLGSMFSSILSGLPCFHFATGVVHGWQSLFKS